MRSIASPEGTDGLRSVKLGERLRSSSACIGSPAIMLKACAAYHGGLWPSNFANTNEFIFSLFNLRSFLFIIN